MMNKSKIENMQPEPQPNDAVKADGLPSAQVEQNPMLAAVYGRKINPLDLFMLDVKSNQFIKKYRDGLGLETPNNRIDTGDLKMIILALYEMGFDVVERLSNGS